MPSGIPGSNGERTPPELARVAGLRYVRDSEAGISRRVGDGAFVYAYPDGRPVRKTEHLARIAELAVPPAWEEVWICRSADGHLQATGRDARGRKQYIYHERWGEISNLAKFERLQTFGRTLPLIRKTVREALDDDAPTLRKMSAVLVALLDRTFARIGNEEYVRANNSFGLSTLRRRHVRIENGCVELSFQAKGGLDRLLKIEDPALVPILKRCVERRTRRLFRYLGEDGRWEDLESDQVNDFLRDVAGEAFTAKDFRTWKASALVAGDLYRRRAEPDADPDARAAVVRDAVDRAAEVLGNTRAICRTYYTHPVLIESFEEGTFLRAVDGFRPTRRKWLDEDEQVLLRLHRHFEG